MPHSRPVDGPLHIDAVPLPAGGRIGLTHCPGRSGHDGHGRRWQRDLAADLAAIEAWPAQIVVSLIEAREFARFGVPDLAERMRARSFAWHHVPIPDMQVPGADALATWEAIEADLEAALRRGEHVLLHCAAGLGRTGTMAARLLATRFGYAPDAAIRLVRMHRPGAIETPAQEAFVRAIT